jgi:hypothetical protein
MENLTEKPSNYSLQSYSETLRAKKDVVDTITDADETFNVVHNNYQNAHF